MSQDCESCGAEPAGVWFVYYLDYSGFAVFPTEIEALRYAVRHSMECEFREWGSLRGGG